MQLPTVDYTAENAAEQFVESLRNTGFGVLKNHPISQDLVESIYKNWQDFFNSSENTIFCLVKKHKMVIFRQRYLKSRKVSL